MVLATALISLSLPLASEFTGSQRGPSFPIQPIWDPRSCSVNVGWVLQNEGDSPTVWVLALGKVSGRADGKSARGQFFHRLEEEHVNWVS